MDDVFSPIKASLPKIDALANWVRDTTAKTGGSDFDVIRFIEIDLPRIIDDFYVEIEQDDALGNRRAYIDDEFPILVVSESIYYGAKNNCRFSIGVILHEIGHLFLHSKYQKRGLNNSSGNYNPSMLKMKIYESAEWQANMFSLSFMYPSKQYRRYSRADDLAAALSISKKHAELVIRHITKVEARKKYEVASETISWVKKMYENNTLLKKRTEKINENPQARLFG